MKQKLVYTLPVPSAVGMSHVFTFSMLALTVLTAPKTRREMMAPKLPIASDSQYSVYSCISFTPGC